MKLILNIKFIFKKQTHFDNIFDYKLQDENAKRIAKEGLTNSEYTSPVTMATQFKYFLSITIKNDINKEENKYNVDNRKKTKNISLSIVTKLQKKLKMKNYIILMKMKFVDFYIK